MPIFQTVRFGDYHIVEKVAAGGMAELYRAKRIGLPGFERFVAIKQILPHLAEDEEVVSAFINEAKLAALLNHQNIVQIYECGNIKGTYFICMEYLFGKDLRRIFAKYKEKNLPLGIEYALYITSRICYGLDYAHKLKDFQGKSLHIIHRDISPQNIFVTYEGDVKIVDFGIAKAASRESTLFAGMIKGKVRYMSPEQASGKTTIDYRSDIFSTGILLYEMITNKQMFKGDTFTEILANVREAKFDAPEMVKCDLPEKLCDILHRALAKEPEQRYQSCGEMLSDLEECMIELSLRPTARGLAQYMKKLFDEEIAAESEVIREAAAISAAEESKPEKALQPAERSQEKTRAMAEKAAPPKSKKKRPLFAAIAVVLIAIGLLFVFFPKGKPVSVPSKLSEKPAPSMVSPETAKVPEKVTDSVEKAKALQKQASGLVETNPQKAKTLLLQAITLDPESVEGHFELGLVYAKLKNYSEAIKTYQKVAELAPKFPDIYFNLGYMYALSKDYAKAEEMYSKVVKLAPPYLDEALFNIAMVQEKQGKRKQCIENLKRALEVNPKNTLAKEYLNKLKGGSKEKA